MAKVSVHLGFTFRVGTLDRNQYGRIDLSLDQIDTELPLDTQLDESKEVADKVFEYIQQKVDAQMDDMLDDAS